MKHHIYFIYLIVGIFDFVQHYCLAQENPGGFVFEHITVNEGLPHSDIHATIQDKEGFLWIGTGKGLCKYDGYEFQNFFFSVEDTNSLSSSRISTLYCDQFHQIWIGTVNGGLNVFDKEKHQFTRVCQQNLLPIQSRNKLNLSNASISTIISDIQGNIYAGTRQRGLIKINRNSKGEILSLESIAWGKKQAYSVTSLIKDKLGNVWVSTLDKGIFYIDVNTKQLKKINFPKKYNINSVLGLHLDIKDNLWIGTQDNLYCLPELSQAIQKSFFTNIFSAPPNTFEGVSYIFRDSFGNIWLSTQTHLSCIQSKYDQNIAQILKTKPTPYSPDYAHKESINAARIYHIFEDSFQNIWFSTVAGGLNKIDLHNKKFFHLSRDPQTRNTLASNYVNSFFYDENRQKLWIGTRNGIRTYDWETNTFENYLQKTQESDVSTADIITIFRDSGENMWFGTWVNNGVIIKPKGKKRFINLKNQAPNAFGFFEDKEGYIWIATQRLGFFKCKKDGSVVSNFNQQNSELVSDSFTNLFYDKQEDVVWAGTLKDGLLKLKIKKGRIKLLKHFKFEENNPNSLAFNHIWPITKDYQGNIWVGTLGGGLHKITKNQSGKEIVYRYRSLVPEGDIESILVDKKGNLWMGGSGLFKFNPSDSSLLHYDVDDGLQSNSFKVGAALQTKDGLMYFGGINGINYFYPDQIKPNKNPPKLVFTDLKIFNEEIKVGNEINQRVLLPKSLSFTKEITIKAAENDFSIDFVALHFSNPKKNRIKYKLDRYHKDWVYLSEGQRSANFANLRSGSYVLWVKAANSDGLWTKEAISLKINILPPWWRTWWAYILYAIAILGILMLIRRLSLIQQNLKNKLALETIQREKDKELNDLKIKLFTNVSHELRTPLTLIMGPLEDLLSLNGKNHFFKDRVLLMHKQTQKLMNLVNQLLDFRKAETGHLKLKTSQANIIKFVEEIFLVFKLKSEEKQIDYQLFKPENSIKLFFDKDKLEIVLTNIISNAFKYTPNQGKITIDISYQGNPLSDTKFVQGKLNNHYLTLKIIDNGLGMDEQQLDKIFDSFYQATQAESLKVLGTGIGLSLVKNFIDLHQGEIEVKSSPGTGSAFIIKLPFGKKHLKTHEILQKTGQQEEKIYHYLDDESKSNPNNSINNSAEESILIPNQTKILIVEDNDDLRGYIKDLLQNDFQVLEANQGEKAWEIIQQNEPDLVLTDIMMPVRDGLDLCKQIKSNPKTNHIPVIMLTARSAVTHELEGMETGANDYITKPFNPKILKTKLQNLIYNQIKIKQFYHKQILMEPTNLEIKDTDKEFLQKAMQIVEKNLDNSDLNVQFLAQEMAMSQSGFYRKLKNITGTTAVDFIRDVRMKRAAQLLKESNMRVSEIALEVGIEDVKYFRKLFQKVFQVSPSAYAKLHKAI